MSQGYKEDWHFHFTVLKVCSEIQSHVTKAGLELVILPLPLKC